ncbi:MAG: spermidine/putrescine ABC transporter substrate-binding protein [Oscillospiraceae bacterium]|nr:spermidine/putrescine ABC transporter substrate-binding protein [Oscillospiraceae bacterium]
MLKKTIALLCAAMLLLALLSGCGAGKAEEQQLVLYTWESMFPQEVLDGFTERTGVKVIYSNFDYDETMLEKLSAAKGGDYDVVIADDYIIEQAVLSGLVSELDKSAVSNFGNINPLYQGQFYDPDDKYTVPYGAGIPLIVYDPTATDVEIKGYEDLWNPALADSVAITANYRVINGITLLSMGKSMNEEDLDVIAQAGEKLLALAPNIRLIQDDNTQDALLNGEAAAAFLYTSQVTQVMAENPALKVVYPEEGLGFGIMAGFVPVNAPNKDAAFAFLNYILEPEVSKACMEYIGYYNTTGAADDIVDPMLVVPSSVSSGEIIQNVSEAANDAYNRNWTEFRAACGQ